MGEWHIFWHDMAFILLFDPYLLCFIVLTDTAHGCHHYHYFVVGGDLAAVIFNSCHLLYLTT